MNPAKFRNAFGIARSTFETLLASVRDRITDAVGWGGVRGNVSMPPELKLTLRPGCAAACTTTSSTGTAARRPPRSPRRRASCACPCGDFAAPERAATWIELEHIK